jgi:hypothetical protein
MMRRVLFVVALTACDGTLSEQKSLASLDEPYFRCKVQPVLTKSCSAFACHGDGKRFFRVFARNRLRAQGAEKDRNAPLTDVERAANFEAARAFVDEGTIEDSLLLVKPLDIAGGRRFHRGREIYGAGDVFADRNDPDFKTLLTWIQGAKESPTCLEPGSDK